MEHIPKNLIRKFRFHHYLKPPEKNQVEYLISQMEFGQQMRSRMYLYHFIILLLVVLYYYYLKVAQIIILSCFRPLSNSILVKNSTFTSFQLVCDGPTDGPTDGRTDGRRDGGTDGRTDTPSYRDARTHLKKKRCTKNS